MTSNERAAAEADRKVPKYRLSGRTYCCTGRIAKQWSDAYEEALRDVD